MLLKWWDTARSSPFYTFCNLFIFPICQPVQLADEGQVIFCKRISSQGYQETALQGYSLKYHQAQLEFSGKHFTPTLWFNITAQTSDSQMPYPLSPPSFFLTTSGLSQKEITMQIPVKVQIHKRGTSGWGGWDFFVLDFWMKELSTFI